MVRSAALPHTDLQKGILLSFQLCSLADAIGKECYMVDLLTHSVTLRSA